MPEIIIDDFSRSTIIEKETDGKNDVWRFIIGKPVKSYSDISTGNFVGFRFSNIGLVPWEQPQTLSLSNYPDYNKNPLIYSNSQFNKVYFATQDAYVWSYTLGWGFQGIGKPISSLDIGFSDIEWGNGLLALISSTTSSIWYWNGSSWSSNPNLNIYNPMAILFWRSLWYFAGIHTGNLSKISIFDSNISTKLVEINFSSGFHLLDLIPVGNNYLIIVGTEYPFTDTPYRTNIVLFWDGSWFGSTPNFFFQRFKMNGPVVYVASVNNVPFIFVQNNRDLEVWIADGFKLRLWDIIERFSVCNKLVEDAISQGRFIRKRITKVWGSSLGDWVVLRGKYTYDTTYSPVALIYNPLQKISFVYDKITEDSWVPPVLTGIFDANLSNNRVIELFDVRKIVNDFVLYRRSINERVLSQNSEALYLLSNWFTFGTRRVKIKQIDVFWDTDVNVYPFNVKIYSIDETTGRSIDSYDLSSSDTYSFNFLKRFSNIGVIGTRFQLEISLRDGGNKLPVLKRIIINYEFVS